MDKPDSLIEGVERMHQERDTDSRDVRALEDRWRRSEERDYQVRDIYRCVRMLVTVLESREPEGEPRSGALSPAVQQLTRAIGDECHLSEQATADCLKLACE